MAETISFAQSLEIAHGFHLLSPFPGTDVRERAAEFGLKILSDDWSLYDADHAITETESLPAVQVQAFARRLEARSAFSARLAWMVNKTSPFLTWLPTFW